MVDRFLVRILVRHLDRGAEGDLVATQLAGIDDLGAAGHVLEFGNSALDEGLFLARGVIFGVLRQIAMLARLGDRLNHGRPLVGLQMRQFRLDCVEPLWGEGNLFHCSVVCSIHRRTVSTEIRVRIAVKPDHHNPVSPPADTAGDPLFGCAVVSSAGDVGQEILQCANTEVALLQGPNGLCGGATA